MSDAADAVLAAALAELSQDRVRGAAELARLALAAVDGYARALTTTDPLRCHQQLATAARQLRTTRPSMAPLANLLGKWLAALPSPEALRPLPAPEALRWLRHSAASAAATLTAGQTTARHTADALRARQVRRLLTHSRSATVLAALHQLLPQPNLTLLVCEGRPGGEGREVAAAVAAWGVPVRYAADAQGGLLMQEADLMLVGADSVLADGAVINKAGTALLALAAQAAGVPVWVACESAKYAPHQEARLEVLETASLDPPAHPLVTAHLPWFDRTPAHLISAWINETGLHHPFTAALPPS